jgi:hypothetical protein
MTELTEPLDHVVINVLHDMEAAAGIFTALGFTLTPRGHHTLGSINHLMVVPGAYLELVGVPAEGKQRQEVLDSPMGLNGLVFRITDAHATYARLREGQLDPAEPVAFSRPVEIDGETLDASFRTVKVSNALFPAGRVYFCEHLTPELVWRQAWMSHANGFCGFDRIAVDSDDPRMDALRYARASNAGASPRETGWRVDAGDFAIDIEPANTPRFSALGLRFECLKEIASRARTLDGIEWSGTADDLAILTIPTLDLRIECRSVS